MRVVVLFLSNASPVLSIQDLFVLCPGEIVDMRVS